MPAYRMGDEPRCAESEFKDDRHDWIAIGVDRNPYQAERCHKCQMWRIGTRKHTGIRWRYIPDDDKEVGAAPADGERA